MWFLRSIQACVQSGKLLISQKPNNNNSTLHQTVAYIRRFSEKKVFSRDRPCCKVGTIGHAKHGKSTLTAAITQSLDGNDFGDKSGNESTKAAQFEYVTENRHYIHTDCPGDASYVKNMMSGVTQMDGAILVIAATDGVMDQTHEHTLLAKQIGIKHLVVFINKIDVADAETVDLVEMEAREMLTTAGFDGNRLPVVRGSALCALNGSRSDIGSDAIHRLLNEIDTYIPTPIRDLDKPFVLPIERIFSVPNRGTVVRGILEQGVLGKGDKCEILGFDRVFKAAVTSLEMCYQTLEVAQAGDQVSALLRGVQRDDLKRGMILAKPGCLKLVDHVDAQVYALTKEEGGRFKPFSSYSMLSVFSKTWECTAQAIIPDDSDIISGEHSRIALKLIKPMVFEIGQTFTIREGQMTLGTGVVTAVHKNLTEDERSDILGGRRRREKNARLAEQKTKKSR